MSFEQEVGRVKRLPVSKAQGKIFVALDGKAVQATSKFDALQAVNILHFTSSCTLKANVLDFEMITYQGGLLVLPKTDYLHEVGKEFTSAEA